MAIRSSQFFNNPAFAQAASNLTALFAPPSGADAAGWARAAAERDAAARLQWLFDNTSDPTFDRYAIVADLYDPTSSFYAQDQNNATAIRGQDVAAATSRANNAADNARALEEQRIIEQAATQRLGVPNVTDIAKTRISTLGSLFGPVAQDAIRPAVPPAVAAQFGLDAGLPAVAGLRSPLSETEAVGGFMSGLTPEEQRAIALSKGTVSVNQGERVRLPDGSVVEGAPKPLSATEWEAVQKQRLLEGGKLSDELLIDSIMGERTPVQVVGPDGQPVFSTPGAAARTGAQAYVNKGAEAKATNATAVLADGTQVPAVQRPGENVWRHAQTGAELPPDIRIMDLAKVTGSAADVGLADPVISDLQKSIVSIDNTLDTASTLRQLIVDNPSSQGIVGSARRLAQNLFRTASEVGGTAPALKEITDAVQSGMLENGAQAMFDPSLPDIELLTNYLAWQYAKAMSGDRVSNEQLRQAKDALGGNSILSNQADSVARLDRIIQQLNGEKERAEGKLRSGSAASTVNPPATAAPKVRVYNPATGRIE